MVTVTQKLSKTELVLSLLLAKLRFLGPALCWGEPFLHKDCPLTYPLEKKKLRPVSDLNRN